MFVIPIQFSKISHATWSVLDYSINIYSLCQLLFWVFLKLFFGPLSLYPLRLFHCPLKVHFLSISLLSALLYYHPFPSIGKSYSSGLNGKWFLYFFLIYSVFYFFGSLILQLPYFVKTDKKDSQSQTIFLSFSYLFKTIQTIWILENKTLIKLIHTLNPFSHPNFINGIWCFYSASFI